MRNLSLLTGQAPINAPDSDKLHEECAVFGVSISNTTDYAEAAGITYNALLAMQHRGQ